MFHRSSISILLAIALVAIGLVIGRRLSPPARPAGAAPVAAQTGSVSSKARVAANETKGELLDTRPQRQAAASTDESQSSSKLEQPAGEQAPAARRPAAAKTSRLLEQTDLQYVGAFRTPWQTFGASSLSYGGTALAYNPVNNSLFIVGHDHQQCVGELSIPEIRTGAIGGLAICTVTQPFVDIRAKIPNRHADMSIMGGLLVVGKQLVGSMYIYYDATHQGKASHFKLSSLDLATAQVTGMFQVGTLGGGFVGGPMCAIPPEWEERLGAAYMTGLSSVPIVGRTSAGPGSAFGFDPAQLGASPARAIPYVYHPYSRKTFGDGSENVPGLHNIWNWTAMVKGVVFPHGTDTVLFFGRLGVGPFVYQGGSDAKPYEYKVWAYDANDFLAVKKGAKRPWDVVPYGVWKLNSPYQPDPNWHNGTIIGGAAYDPATKRIFLSCIKENDGATTPVIHVFQLP